MPDDEVTGSDLGAAIKNAGSEDNPEGDPSDDEPESQGDNSPEPSGESDATPSDQPEQDLPEKFRGKSKEDIVQQYQELESKLGEQGNEMQELREEIAEFRGMMSSQSSESEEQSTQEDVVEQVIEENAENLPDPLEDPEGYQRQVMKLTRQALKEDLQAMMNEELQPVREQVQSQQSQELMSRYASDRDEFDQYKDTMGDLVEEHEFFKVGLQQASTYEEASQVLDQILAAAKDREGDLNSSQQPSARETKATSTNGQGRDQNLDSSSGEKPERVEQAEERIALSMDPNM